RRVGPIGIQTRCVPSVSLVERQPEIAAKRDEAPESVPIPDKPRRHYQKKNQRRKNRFLEYIPRNSFAAQTSHQPRSRDEKAAHQGRFSEGRYCPQESPSDPITQGTSSLQRKRQGDGRGKE